MSSLWRYKDGMDHSKKVGVDTMSNKPLFVVEEDYGEDDGIQPTVHMTIRTKNGEVGMKTISGDFVPVVFFKKKDAYAWIEKNLTEAKVVEYVKK